MADVGGFLNRILGGRIRFLGLEKGLEGFLFYVDDF